jgi:tellurite resistance protein
MSDDSRYRAAIKLIHPGALSEADAETVVAIAQLTVDVDGREDAEEISKFFAMGKAIFSHAGFENSPTPTFAGDEEDDERLRALAGQLSTPAAKELAYAVAYMMAVADTDLAPEEGALVDALRETLGLTEDRADEIAASVSAAITPPA